MMFSSLEQSIFVAWDLLRTDRCDIYLDLPKRNDIRSNLFSWFVGIMKVPSFYVMFECLYVRRRS